MKTNLLFVMVFTFICLNVNAQTYYPFQTDSATWTVVEYGFSFPVVTGVTHLGLSGDTILNGNTYTKVYVNAGGLGQVNPDTAFNLQTAQFYGGFREDSTHKIWVIRNYFPIDTVEYLYYDFSLNVGDTFCFQDEPCGVNCHPVSLVDSILVNGSYRRQIHFSYGGQEEVWIEGIGSAYDNWIGKWCFIGNLLWVLNCYSENGVPIYGTCDYPTGTGVNEISITNNPVKIFPNPVNDFLNIENGVNGATITIESVLGEILLTQLFVADNSIINLGSLSCGMYFLHYSDGKKESIWKIVKQ